MKKNQPNPDPLYAKVNKPSRTPHTPSTEEVIYADVSTGNHQQHPGETVYAEVNTRGSRGNHQQHPSETIYAEVNTRGGRGNHQQQTSQAAHTGASAERTPTPPRSPKDEVTRKLLQNTNFQYGVREVQEWSKVVYGNEHALNEQLSKILDDPKNAEKVLRDLAENPESPAKLAGRKALGIKSQARKEAEDGFSPLCSALERHIHTTQKLHKQFTREQERERGQRHESPERDSEHRHHHHHHRHHHAKGREHANPEHNSQQRKHATEKGVAYAV
ncbi:BID domain-containing T4SS effector [Bartonella sp. TS25HLJMH]|uniref:BID domain-containing T4SS effector n=1 Tax=Bartonella sp. TS25HLJMH TaxID=3243576 RepID=UPI0035CF058D